MKRATMLLGVLTLLLAIAGCGSSGPSEAERYSKGVHVRLSDATVEDMMNAMAPLPASTPPAGVEMTTDLNASNERVYTWTFGDGSAMVFAFKAEGGEGSQQGLVLNWIDLKD